MAQDINTIGRKMALWSFGIGSGLFLLFCITGFEVAICIVALYYTMVAAIANAVIGLIVLLSIVQFKDSRRQLMYTALIMMLNIPAVVVYFFLMSILLGLPWV